MKFEISATMSFSASHQIRLYDGSIEPLHGHNWQVKASVGASTLDSISVVMDFHELERRMQSIFARFEDRHLNEVAPFDSLNPSAENVALYIGQNLALPPRVRLLSIEVWETPANSALVRFD